MNSAQNLWSQLLADINDPNLQWQLLTLAGCIALGWWLSRFLSRRLLGQVDAVESANSS